MRPTLILALILAAGCSSVTGPTVPTPIARELGRKADVKVEKCRKCWTFEEGERIWNRNRYARMDWYLDADKGTIAYDVTVAYATPFGKEVKRRSIWFVKGDEVINQHDLDDIDDEWARKFEGSPPKH